MGSEVERIVTADGESAASWAIVCEPGFLGSSKQLINCARCGEVPPFKRQDEPRHYRDIGKPTVHLVCDECYDALPD